MPSRRTRGMGAQQMDDSGSMFHRYFQDAAHKVQEVREKAATGLRVFVETEMRDMSLEASENFVRDLTTRIFNLVNSGELNAKLGGIAIIDELIDLKSESQAHETMIIRFANCFRILFQQASSHSDPVVLQKASKALGHLARARVTMKGDIVEFQVRQSLEWLQEERNPRRRLAAVLVLKEIAQNTPTLFNVHVNQFLEHIWVALRDPSLEIREGAVAALGACLKDIAKRAENWKLQCHYKIFNEAQAGFQVKKSNVSSIHGSLLTIGELLRGTSSFMETRFREVCETVLKYKSNSNPLIARTVISLLPRLAALSPEGFVRGGPQSSYLDICLEHIISQLTTANRDTVFIALGEISMAVGEHMLPQLDRLVQLVQQGLTRKKGGGKKGTSFSYTALTCVGLLAKGLGDKLFPHMDRLVDQMFDTGLNQTLIDALRELTANIPQLLPTIQERLLDQISEILSAVFLDPAAGEQVGMVPKHTIRGLYGAPELVGKRSAALEADSVGMGLMYSGKRAKAALAPSRYGSQPVKVHFGLVVLALRTLGTFEFDFHMQGVRLTALMRECVLQYLDYEHPLLRKEAAVTCTNLIPRLAEHATHFSSTRMLFEILKRLVVVSIADTEPSIRLSVLGALDSRLDKFLSQAEILQTLFVARNDEVFAIREVAISLLGRLSNRNPALVMPCLRKQLIQLLSELQQFSSDTLDQEESSRLLGHLIGNAQKLIKPYVAPILEVLMPKLTADMQTSKSGAKKPGKQMMMMNGGGSAQPAGGVATYVLSTLGQLSTICGEDMTQYLDGLMPLIIDTLQDKTTIKKRQVALRTLAQLVSSTGFVVRPCVQYPHLLPLVLSVLVRERIGSLRLAALEVLGTLGALDPHKYKQTQLRLKVSRKATSGERAATNEAGAGPAGPDGPNKKDGVGDNANGKDQQQQEKLAPTVEQSHSSQMLLHNQNPETYYPTVAINALMRVLQDSGLSPHHNMVIKAIMFIFRSLSLKCVPFLPRVIPTFLRQMRQCEDTLRESYFIHLTGIVSIATQHARPFVDGIFAAILEYWESQPLKVGGHIIALVEEISLAMPDDFKAHLPELIPKLMRILQHDRSEYRVPSHRVLHCIQTCGQQGTLDGYLYVILPALMRLCEQSDESFAVRLSAIQTVRLIARHQDVSDHASRLVHPFCRILASTPLSPLHAECLGIFCLLVKQLGFGYTVFEPMVAEVIASSQALAPTVTQLSGGKAGKDAAGSAEGGSAYTPLGQLRRYNALVARLLQRLQDNSSPYKLKSQRGGSSGAMQITGGGSSGHGRQRSTSSQNGGDAGDSRSSRGSRTRSTSSNTAGGQKGDRNSTDSGRGGGATFHQGVGHDDLSQELDENEEAAEKDRDKRGLALLARRAGIVGDSRNGRELRPDVGNGMPKMLPFSQQNLMKAWAASQRSTKDDWVVWMQGFSIELLKESPSSSLRACSALAQKYPPLAKELFNAAFLSCWTELFDQYQDDLIHSLETTFESPSIPPEIVQTLLNLAGFMEHHDKALPIDIRTLGDLAARCHAYAKALHYKETEFHTSPSTTIEALISINNKLQQPEAARGILKFAQRHHSVKLKESWYEKLERWEDALEAYERKQMEDPLDFDCTLGRMRCLQSLGEWERLYQLSRDLWGRTKEEDTQMRRRIAPLACSAACNLRAWDELESYVGVMSERQVSGTFYRAILAVHREQFEQAEDHIGRSLRHLDSGLKALVGESYNRAYSGLIKVQQVIELGEVIKYKKGTNERRALIRKMWSERLRGCQRNVRVWQDVLSVRSLVVSPQEDTPIWLSFAALCRESGMLPLSGKVLTTLMGINPQELVHSHTPLPTEHPDITLAALQHLYKAGYKTEAFSKLSKLVAQDMPNELKAQAYLKLGVWQLALMEDLHDATGQRGSSHDPQVIQQVLSHFHAATECDGASYKAWHEWAVMNFRVVSHYSKQNPHMGSAQATKLEASNHIVPAIQGFFRSIWLQQISEKSRQDVLRLLALWFEHGTRPDVESSIEKGIATISIDTWLAVIPQLIARIHTPHERIRRLLQQLLCKIGKAHPQAMVYPLTVASKSEKKSRMIAARNVLKNMRIHSSDLVEQANMVSQELVRVAILWHELWHEAIEDASRYYFGQKNPKGMIDTLYPLHKLMEKGPQTMREVAFQQAYGKELQDAYEWCQKYLATGTQTLLNRAWDLYSSVFRRMTKEMGHGQGQVADLELELQDVSTKLLLARDMQLAVPGMYRAGQPVVRISHFEPTLRVIESKQHPRKLVIGGSDGRPYMFLLKGHEDLRQDERVMQLFGLVNTLLSNDRNTAKNDLQIHRYAVIPLSPNSGLIEWVPHCDTIHALIKQYREARKIVLNIEQRLMLKMGPDYQNLTLIQKVEVFEYALSMTTGQDLCKVLWLKSPNAEVWLDRRTNFTRSLAVMSMVGYVLGLGDRHPCNLMLDRNSGKIIHIDFGDCFEVAMQREKFPEKVPFRLTRMLVNAMEVSGIEGTFRSTCESVMRVLHKNKNSVMAVLEAFVYDPLINWRLLVTDAASDGAVDTSTGGGTSGSGAGNGDSADNSNKKGDGGNNDPNNVTAAKKSNGDEMNMMDAPNSLSVSATPDKARLAYSASLRSKQQANAVNGGANGGTAQEDRVEVDENGLPVEQLNKKALRVISRVEAKLKGTDFVGPYDNLGVPTVLDVPAQVQRLIQEATSHENLCQSYIGWCPFW